MPVSDPRWNVRELAWPTDLPASCAAFARRGAAAWLDGAAAEDGWSVLAVDPVATITQAESGRVHCEPHAPTATNPWDAWGKLHRALPRYPTCPVPLAPGWIGYVGFELGRWLERLPARRGLALPIPLLRLGLYPRVMAFDHARRRALAVEAVGLAQRHHADSFDAFCARWNAAASSPSVTATATPTVHDWSFAMPREDYVAMIERARAYIAAGDIYQVNLAQRLDLTGEFEPWALYAALRRANPAAYGALLADFGGSVLSVSPELMLRVEPDGAVLTRPIKGTQPRGDDPEENRAAIAALTASAKDAAELAMIVDLHRNDLGRVCAFRSVRVVAARQLESHPTVFHTVADIRGQLRDACDALDVLRAMFPAGSITGVPKIRAAEIIDELETSARGAYTGAIGNLGLDGSASFNVAIRTLQLAGERAVVYSGGGIVADSDPHSEYVETLHKARGIMRAVGVDLLEGMRVGGRSHKESSCANG